MGKCFTIRFLSRSFSLKAIGAHLGNLILFFCVSTIYDVVKTKTQTRLKVIIKREKELFLIACYEDQDH